MTPYAAKKKRARKKSAKPKKLARKPKTKAKRSVVRQTSSTRKVAKKSARAKSKAPAKRSAAKRKTAKRSAAKKRPVAKKRVVAKRPVAKKRIVAKRPVAKKRVVAKRPVAKKRVVSKKQAAAKAKAAREKRNKAARDARALAKAKEALRQEKLEKARRKRERARARGRAVNKKEQKLREEAEKLRLVKPTSTKQKVLEVRSEVNTAVAAPPKIPVDYTEQFWQLFKIAKKSHQLPTVDYRVRKMDSLMWLGKKRTVRVQQLVTADSVQDILYRVKKATASLGGFRLWMATTIMSTMGPEIVGSGGRVLVASHPLAFKLQTETYDSTGMFNSQTGMLERLEAMLDEWAESETRALVYLHAITIHNSTHRR